MAPAHRAPTHYKLLTLLVGILLAVAMVGPHAEQRVAQACNSSSLEAAGGPVQEANTTFG